MNGKVSRLCESRLRQKENDLRRKLLATLESSQNNREQTLTLLAQYQRRVCLAVRKAFEISKPHLGSVAALWFDQIDWNMRVCRRRFSQRIQPILRTDLVPGTPFLFSLILGWMRHDSYENGLAHQPRPLCVDHFTTFFFRVRCLFGACVEKQLYAILTIVPKPTFNETVLTGFTIVQLEPKYTPKRKNKRRRPLSTLWVELFEVFSDFRRYGIGKGAAQLIPKIMQKSHPNTKATEICLHPLDSAEPFWLACHFHWHKQDQYLRKPIPTKKRRIV